MDFEAKIQTNKKFIYPQLPQKPYLPVELEMNQFKAAVELARDPQMPLRHILYGFYEKALKDGQVIAQYRTALYTVQKAPFEIRDKKNHKPIDKLHYLFDRQWFLEFLQYALDTEFWGHSLLEFSNLNENNEFSQVWLIPRQFVRPETGEIVTDVNQTYGWNYRQYMDKLYLLELGDKYDLGLLEMITREVIYKNYARSDWSLAAERFGMPILVVKTDAQGDELDKIENMAQNIATNGYIITATNDDIDIKTFSGHEGFYRIYQEKIKYCDQQISKIINGQTMTSDDGSSYSQAMVHERILNSYTYARLQRLQNVINDSLFPFLVRFGYPLDNTYFQFTELLQIEQPDTEQNSDVKKNSISDINDLYGLAT